MGVIDVDDVHLSPGSDEPPVTIKVINNKAVDPIRRLALDLIAVGTNIELSATRIQIVIDDKDDRYRIGFDREQIELKEGEAVSVLVGIDPLPGDNPVSVVLAGFDQEQISVTPTRLSLTAEAPSAMVRVAARDDTCLLYTSPSPRDRQKSRMPSSA